jgi:hypothetical protein
MNKNSMIAAMIVLSLISAVYVNIAYAQQVLPGSTVQLRKPASGTTTPASAIPKQHITKIKISSPTRGQQIPVGKELTISGSSIDNADSNCQVSVRVNKVSPYQLATSASGTKGGASATNDDYSKWNFVLTSKYTIIKPGQNRITAKYECGNNPALTSFSSVNVTGVKSTTTTKTIHTTSPRSITSTLGSHAPQNKADVSNKTGTTTDDNRPTIKNSGTDKAVGSKGNPSGNPILQNKADEMKNNIIETLKQQLRESG